MRSGGFLVFASMNRAVLFLSIPDLKACPGASPHDHVKKSTCLERRALMVGRAYVPIFLPSASACHCVNGTRVDQYYLGHYSFRTTECRKRQKFQFLPSGLYGNDDRV